MQQLGWVDGRNIRVDLRSGWGTEKLRKNISELIALAPDVLLSAGTASLAQLLQATRTIPIVFANVADPVGAGFIDSLAQPGGNATGFLQAEYSLSGKLAELLKEIALAVTRAAVLRDPTLTAAMGQFAIIQSAAPSLGLDILVLFRQSRVAVSVDPLSKNPDCANWCELLHTGDKSEPAHSRPRKPRRASTTRVHRCSEPNQGS